MSETLCVLFASLQLAVQLLLLVAVQRLSLSSKYRGNWQRRRDMGSSLPLARTDSRK